MSLITDHLNPEPCSLNPASCPPSPEPCSLFPAPHPLSPAPSFLESASDKLNPILLKELRQAVRNNLVVGILMLFLGVHLIIVGSALLQSGDSIDITLGRNVFLGSLAILQITCLGFVPFYACIRLSMERNSPDYELMYVTTLSSEAVIRGKLLSAMALTTLIFSACMPFITLTYTLRGIDLPTIFFTLAATFCLCLLANMAGIFVGSFRASLLVRGFLGAGLLLALLIMFIVAIPMITVSIGHGAGVNWSSGSFWAALITLLFVEFIIVQILYYCSVGIVSGLKAVNHQLSPVQPEPDSMPQALNPEP
jgi:hypothetical protein